MGKSVFASKTLWVNVLAGAALFLGLPEFSAISPESTVKFAALAIATINIVLRFITKEPVHL